jgi:hypothetical protein
LPSCVGLFLVPAKTILACVATLLSTRHGVLLRHFCCSTASSAWKTLQDGTVVLFEWYAAEPFIPGVLDLFQLFSVRILCITLRHCCLPRLQSGRCCLRWTRPSLLQFSVVARCLLVVTPFHSIVCLGLLWLLSNLWASFPSLFAILLAVQVCKVELLSR